ncbi:sensory neuron membrane protein 1-like isoform X1 [Hylaeus volcanicus]|uniref:sensory neuron membrane protein 1-like isoform X1 n=2 Tax=Hylaeus volcanicus TaxID=313075 RepID=UPI0023B7F3C6|nr:sensory neuron membrane protein 1-like isoform X1 [Hylaeus volcanicus]
MNFKRFAYDFARRFFRRSINLSQYSSILGLFSFLITGRKLHNTLPAPSRCKCITMKPKKMAIIGGSMFSFGVLFCSIIFPPFLKSQIKKQVRLKDGSEMRELWSDFPYPFEFKMYLFNVTNPVEVTAGEKPILQQVGPFYYDEFKQKVNLVDREEDDSVEYNTKVTWYFNAAKSNPLTGDEELFVPHVVILTIVKITLMLQPGAMGVVNKAMDSIFKKPSSVFVRAKAKDILFEGLPIDCTVKDFAGSAVCGQLKEKEAQFRKEGEGQYFFSLFGGKNATPSHERIRVLRGIKNYKDVGRVIEFDGKPALTTWPEDHCNTLNGTDASIFPPLMTTDDDIVSFAPDLCRSLSAQYRFDTKVRGLKTYRYTTDLGDSSSNPKEKCYCPTPETCLSKDLYDLYKCMGVPLVGSQPHFFGADKKYLQMVDGLDPDEEKHDLSMDFEPMTATPIVAHTRLQFNMLVGPVEKFKLMKKFPECLLPIFWIEEDFNLPDKLMKKLKMVFMLKRIIGILKYITIFVGMGMGGGAAAMMYKNKDTNKEVTKVTPQSQNGTNGEQKKWPPQINVSTIQSAAVPASLDKD